MWLYVVNYVTINSKTQPPYLTRTPGQGGTDLSLTGYDSWRSFGTACYMLGLRGGTTRAGIGAMYGTVMGGEGGVICGRIVAYITGEIKDRQSRRKQLVVKESIRNNKI